MTTPSNPRDLVRQARSSHPFSLDRVGHHALILKLADALEAALDQEARLAVHETDEAALRRTLNEGHRTLLLVWADLLEDRGGQANHQTAEGLRWLAKHGKWPGSLAGRYRWAEDRYGFGDSASWCLGEAAMRLVREDPTARDRGCKPWEAHSISGALLIAARAVGKLLAEGPPKGPPAHADNPEPADEILEPELTDVEAMHSVQSLLMCETLADRPEEDHEGRDGTLLAAEAFAHEEAERFADEEQDFGGWDEEEEEAPLF